jgi:hypothetical protein
MRKGESQRLGKRTVVFRNQYSQRYPRSRL